MDSCGPKKRSSVSKGSIKNLEHIIRRCSARINIVLALEWAEALGSLAKSSNSEIEKIHNQSRQTYGNPRIIMALRARGRRHGRNRVARLMKDRALCGRHRVQTTDSNHVIPSLPIVWPKRPTPPGPKIWVADIPDI